MDLPTDGLNKSTFKFKFYIGSKSTWLAIISCQVECTTAEWYNEIKYNGVKLSTYQLIRTRNNKL